MEEKLKDNLIITEEKTENSKMKKIHQLEDMIILNKNFSSKYLNIYRSIILIIFLIHFGFLIYFLKMEIFIYISKYYTLWAYILTIINFAYFSLKIQNKITSINSDFFHLTIVTNLLVISVFWIYILPFLNFFELSFYEKWNFIYLHSFPFLALLIDFFFNKLFFLNRIVSVLNLLGFFLIYFFVNLFYVKVFDDAPKFSFKWNSIYDFLAISVIFLFNIIFWYFFLWFQRVKFSVKNEFKNNKKVMCNFVF